MRTKGRRRLPEKQHFKYRTMNLLQRIKLDWEEFWDDNFVKWAKRRDSRNVRRTISNALAKVADDGRTYYIIRDFNGNPLAMNRSEIKYLKSHKIISKDQNIKTILESCLAYVDKDGTHFVKFKKRDTLEERINGMKK